MNAMNKFPRVKSTAVPCPTGLRRMLSGAGDRRDVLTAHVGDRVVRAVCRLSRGWGQTKADRWAEAVGRTKKIRSKRKSVNSLTNTPDITDQWFQPDTMVTRGRSHRTGLLLCVWSG